MRWPSSRLASAPTSVGGDRPDRREFVLDGPKLLAHQHGLADPAHPGFGVLQGQHQRAGELTLDPASSDAARPDSATSSSSCPMQLRDLAEVVGLAARVHRERPDVGVGGGRRVAGVGQPAFLPDAAEQPGTHPAAERAGQHGQGGPVGVVADRRPAPRCTGAPARCPARRSQHAGAATWSAGSGSAKAAGAAAASGAESRSRKAARTQRSTSA